jgi:hypothetical protein
MSPSLPIISYDLEHLGKPAVRHSPITISTFLFYIAVGNYAIPHASSRFFGIGYRSLDRRAKMTWNVKAAAMLHSVIITFGSLYLLIMEDDRINLEDSLQRARAYVPSVASYVSLMLGYYVWELSLVIRFPWAFAPGSLMHVFVVSGACILGLVSGHTRFSAFVHSG